MEFARREPTVENGLDRRNSVIGFTPTADRPLCHGCMLAAHFLGVTTDLPFDSFLQRYASSRDPDHMIAVKRAIVKPHRPGDSSEFVRKRNRCPIRVTRLRAPK